jgi:hypothetical protein
MMEGAAGSSFTGSAAPGLGPTPPAVAVMQQQAGDGSSMAGAESHDLILTQGQATALVRPSNRPPRPAR